MFVDCLVGDFYGPAVNDGRKLTPSTGRVDTGVSFQSTPTRALAPGKYELLGYACVVAPDHNLHDPIFTASNSNDLANSSLRIRPPCPTSHLLEFHWHTSKPTAGPNRRSEYGRANCSPAV